MTGAAGNPPESWLEQYIGKVNGISPLGLLEERRQIQAHGGATRVAATQALVLSHLRLVVNIARDYQKYQQPLADLIQEGNISLITAVSSFNSKAGYRLPSFLSRAINAGISRFVLDNWGIVSGATSKEQQRLFVRLRGFKRGTARLNAAEVAAAAAYLRVHEDQIQRLDERLGEGDIPFVAGPGGIRHQQLLRSCIIPISDGIAGVENLQWRQRRTDRLLRALNSLDQRTRHIVQQRWLSDGKKSRLRDLAREYRLSAERIRQIQGQAFDTLRPLIR